MSNIVTERCFLKFITEQDYKEVFELYKNPDVRKYLGGPINKETEFKSKFQNMLNRNGGMVWIIRHKEKNSFLGMIYLNDHHDEKDQEISYQLHPSYWGYGYAKETVKAIINYAFNDLKLDRILAETQSGNTASIKLLEGLGMSPFKTLIRFECEQMIFEGYSKMDKAL